MQCIGEGRQLARGALIAAAVAFVGFGQPGDRLSGGWVSGAWAAEGQAYLDRAKTYLNMGDFSAAEIELRKAKFEAPKDANIRALLAQVYLRLSNFPNAEHEARAARNLNAPEADYLLHPRPRTARGPLSAFRNSRVRSRSMTCSLVKRRT